MSSAGSAGGLQAGGDAVDGDEQYAADALALVASGAAQPLAQRDLRVAEDVGERVAALHGRGDRGPGAHELPPRGDPQQRRDGTRVLLTDQVEQRARLVIGQARVLGGDVDVGADERDLGVVDERAEQLPGAVQRLHAHQALLGDHGVERGAEALPVGQAVAALRPREDPRNRA